jgi:hypothetical protein
MGCFFGLDRKVNRSIYSLTVLSARIAFSTQVPNVEPLRSLKDALDSAHQQRKLVETTALHCISPTNKRPKFQSLNVVYSRSFARKTWSQGDVWDAFQG